MIKIKYDADLIKCMTLFETLTRTQLKDCFIDQRNQLVFVVQPGQIGKAIGKRGINVKKLEHSLNRKIKIIEFNSQLIGFIKNLILPLNAERIIEEDNIITITGPDTKTRGLLIGRNAQNLRGYEQITKRYFPIKEIKVN